MLVSGVIASTLLITVLTIPLVVGAILISVDRRREWSRYPS